MNNFNVPSTHTVSHANPFLPTTFRVWHSLDIIVRNYNTLESFKLKLNQTSNIFDFTTAGDWDCVAVVERLPTLHYSVDFIFLSFGIMGFIVEL